MRFQGHVSGQPPHQVMAWKILNFGHLGAMVRTKAILRAVCAPPSKGKVLPVMFRLVPSYSPLPDDATLIDFVPSAMGRPAPSAARRSFSGLFVSAAILQPGDVLGSRYEILRLLGEGGMGAVYQARDKELDRDIALKLIRPELAASPDILARFKQELLLAHQVTHKNVIRIYDLSEADGVKFITMEYVEGSDLRRFLIDKGKVPAAEAVDIIRQICYALHAAHSVGVIHRDLKPQNVMQDKHGRILVMDFGLARSVEADGMTQTGALVGTMEYMSPEQAMGSALDQRSDLFALGLMFFELLTGSVPYKAETALASLLKRNQQRAIPAITVDPNIPKSLSDIVSKCLERDLNLRYQNVQEILNDLDAWQGKRKVAASSSLNVLQRWATVVPVKWIGVGALALVVLVGGGVLLRNKFSSSSGAAVSGPVTSLAILPFRNASGDSNLDWLGSSVAETLATDVGQSAQLRTVSPNRINQIFTDLRIAPSTVLDPATVKRVAEFSSADRLVFGQYVKLGDQIRIDATVQDVKNDRSISLKADAANEKDIPAAVDRLAESIRTQLALPSSVVKQLKATSFQPTTQSVTALRAYNQGLGFQREGKNLDAQKEFAAATKEDSNFALAFAHLGQINGNLGYDNEAEQSVQKAVGLSSNLSETEKYLISAIRAQVLRDYPNAIKAYEGLAKTSSDNSDVQFALSNLYADSGNLDKAREYCQKVLTANPKDIPATIQLGRITIRSGDPQASLDPLNRAFSMAIQTDNPEQRATSLHLTAVAYRMLGKPEEGLRSETDALTIWRQIGQKRGLAYSLNEMGMAQSLLGKTKDAQANYEEALQVRRDIGDKRGLGDTLIDLGNFYGDQGDNDRALKMYKEALQLERDLGNESLQAICLNNIGTTYSLKGQFEDAQAYFQQALQLREKSNVPQDIVEAVHNLADTSAEMGQYEQAISQYLRALDLRRSMDDKRGAAIESYSLGKLFGYQGRFGAAVKSKDEALKTFRDLKDKTYWMAEMLGRLWASACAGRPWE